MSGEQTTPPSLTAVELAEPLSWASDHDALAAIFRALAKPTRLVALQLMLTRGLQPAKALRMGHAELTQLGIIYATPDGNRYLWSVDRSALRAIGNLLH